MKLNEWKLTTKTAANSGVIMAVLDDWEKDRLELLSVAHRLSIFANAYRSHPSRNPEDKLDEVMAILKSLK